MVVWFLVIGAAGLAHVGDNPSVLAALDPTHGVGFLYRHGHIGLVTLGFVFLAVTGGEALYADLGHFGRRPIQTAWLGLVLPALVHQLFRTGSWY
jgi:KUP system potassium uptake protein